MNLWNELGIVWSQYFDNVIPTKLTMSLLILSMRADIVLIMEYDTQRFLFNYASRLLPVYVFYP